MKKTYADKFNKIISLYCELTDELTDLGLKRSLVKLDTFKAKFHSEWVKKYVHSKQRDIEAEFDDDSGSEDEAYEY